ncbi:hypothetical protein Y027_5579 [Burkholderia pseudomallei TSV5]|nr:hypothetical protein Y027_5579 [Burkholderia pseudomallei TSV5]
MRAPRARRPPSGPRSRRPSFPLEAADDHQLHVGRAFAQRLRVLIIGRMIEARRRVRVRELDEHDPPLVGGPLERQLLAAACEEAAAVARDDVGRQRLVTRVFRRIADRHPAQQICRHGSLAPQAWEKRRRAAPCPASSRRLLHVARFQQRRIEQIPHARERIEKLLRAFDHERRMLGFQRGLHRGARVLLMLLLGADLAPMLEQVVHLGHLERRAVQPAVDETVLLARDQLAIRDHLERERGAEIAIRRFDVDKLAALEHVDRTAHLRREAGLVVVAGQRAEQFVRIALERALDGRLIVQIGNHRAARRAIDDVARHRRELGTVPRFAVDDLGHQLALLLQPVLGERARKIPARARRRAEMLDLMEQRPDDLRFGIDLRPVQEHRVAIAAMAFDFLNQFIDSDRHDTLLGSDYITSAQDNEEHLLKRSPESSGHRGGRAFRRRRFRTPPARISPATRPRSAAGAT